MCIRDRAIGETNAKSDDITYPLVVDDKQVFVLGDNWRYPEIRVR